ncbi:MAG TPA: DUF5615 family PIN-like protein [Dehalococcoidia bacterium]
MASLFLDHNLSPRLASLLRRGRHDARTASDLRLDQASDADVLRAMSIAGRIVVSADDDYVRLHRAVSWDHAGILIVPETPRGGLIDLAAAIDSLLRSGHPEANELYRYARTAGWQLVP